VSFFLQANIYEVIASLMIAHVMPELEK